MKLSEFKTHLLQINELNLLLPGGKTVPEHFHITEAGLTTKHFIDCGGKVRTEKNANLQVWVANDRAHRLEPGKLLNILSIAAPLFGTEDLEVEVEYQGETIGRYGILMKEGHFVLEPKATACLASDSCGSSKKKTELSEIGAGKKEVCCENFLLFF
jgi:hypothetical protein